MIPAAVRVLYVDDEPDLLEIAKLFLEQGGEFRVGTSVSAIKALGAQEIPSYDVVVSDYQMPSMDGIEFLKAVRERYGDIPFILFTGKGREEVVIQAINNGADFYLQKGGDPASQFAELAHKIRQAVRRRQTETSLRESERRYRNVVETQTEFISRFKPDGTHVFVNEAYCRHFGKRRDEIIGHRFVPSIPEEDRERVRQHFASFAPGRPVADIEHRVIMPDGSIRWHWWNDHAIFDDTGRVTEFQSIGKDITERKQAEEALRASERQFRQLVEQSPFPITLNRLDGTILYANPKFYDTIGWSSEEVQDLIHWERMGLPDTEFMQEKLSDWKTRVTTAIKAGARIEPVTLPIRRKGGEERIVEFSSVPYGDTVVVIGYDITELKKIEEALSRANRQLSLLGGITRHDIVNKIAVILGYLRVARMKFTDPELTRYLGKIEAATKEIQSQIEFTRIYQDLGTQAPQWTTLAAVMPHASAPAGVSFTADLEGMSVFADPMLENVFFNLLDNSVRHGERVTAIRVSANTSGEQLVIVWEDNGVGIPADDKERIFERGFGKHTGLGLFLIREILALTGISIAEKGEPGKGVRFEITVPEGAYRTKRA